MARPCDGRQAPPAPPVRASFKHHAHVILAANFALTMFTRKSEVNSCLSLRLAGSEGESPNMKSIHRSILTRALTAGVASLALAMSARAAFALLTQTVPTPKSAPRAL
jgi:hypothetical protein